MVDYKSIADKDAEIGLTTIDTFNVMKSETEIVTTDEVMVNYIRISASVNVAASMALEASVDAAVEGGLLPKWVGVSLHGNGININDPQTANFVRTLLPAKDLPGVADSIVAMGERTVYKYPNIKQGHIDDARAMRERGEV
jgi:hypothetical protein